MFPNISRLIEINEGRRLSVIPTPLPESFWKKEVAVVPGSGFGSDVHVRLSYATSMDTMLRTQTHGRVAGKSKIVRIEEVFAFVLSKSSGMGVRETENSGSNKTPFSSGYM